MSASLVGSEMCIRDRTCQGPTPIPGDQYAAERIQRAIRDTQNTQRVETCLLYTSDAADDM
eukprot:3334641-Alexandrium_andersonii.AAC.1